LSEPDGSNRQVRGFDGAYESPYPVLKRLPVWENLRAKSVSGLSQVSEAHLEHSVIEAKPEPKVVEVRAADGVQAIRVEIAGWKDRLALSRQIA
jgi:hypothetical protein